MGKSLLPHILTAVLLLGYIINSQILTEDGSDFVQFQKIQSMVIQLQGRNIMVAEKQSKRLEQERKEKETRYNTQGHNSVAHADIP